MRSGRSALLPAKHPRAHPDGQEYLPHGELHVGGQTARLAAAEAGGEAGAGRTGGRGVPHVTAELDPVGAEHRSRQREGRAQIRRAAEIAGGSGVAGRQPQQAARVGEQGGGGAVAGRRVAVVDARQQPQHRPRRQRTAQHPLPVVGHERALARGDVDQFDGAEHAGQVDR